MSINPITHTEADELVFTEHGGHCSVDSANNGPVGMIARDEFHMDSEVDRIPLNDMIQIVEYMARRDS